MAGGILSSLIMLGAMAMVSCSGRGGDGDADSASGAGLAFDSVMPETIDADTVKEEKEKPLVIRSREEIERFIAESPDRARYEKGIIPTMAKYVPEYASRLLDNEYDGFLIVDKNTMKIYRYDKYGVEQERVGMACSRNYGTKHARRDNRTPEGFFTISGIYDSTEWLYTDDDGKTSPVKGQFGPRFMRLKTPVTSQVGIHGTCAPWSIGGRRSHGCIRMTNENIMRIHELCSVGEPVIVSPGPRDMAVNEQEGYYVPSVPVVPGGEPCRPGKYSEADLAPKQAAPAASAADTTSSSSTSVVDTVDLHPETTLSPSDDSLKSEKSGSSEATPVNSGHDEVPGE